MHPITPPTVLLVDDGLAERKLFAMAGKKAGVSYALQEAGDGAEAITYLLGEGVYANRVAHPFPALVMLDLNMPGMSGFEVLEWIRNQPSARDLPVIMWTSSTSEADIAQASALGANSYLVKPLSLAALVDMVRTIDSYWLKLHRAAAANAGASYAATAT
jgi:CheY-like chemotaxis protein